MGNKYCFKQSNISKLPNTIICYWISDDVVKHLSNDKVLSEMGNAKQGLSTSDNNRFLRFWYEVVLKRINFNAKSCEDTETSDYRWYPYNKAGNFRRWSSINQYVVNYEKNGKEIKDTVMKKYPYLRNPDFVVKNTESYFSHGITWNDVSTDLFCCRFVPDGFIFADAAPMFFTSHDKEMLAYFNSCVFQVFADIICQGLHYSTGQIPQIPVIDLGLSDKEEITHLVDECYEMSKMDWDSYEESWDFKKHPLL